MHLERGPEFYQKQFFRTCILTPHWGGFDKVMEWDFFSTWVSYLLLNHTFVLLVDVKWFEDRSILLQLMRRTYYQWYFYLLILFTYVLSNKSFLIIYIWKFEMFSYHYYTSVWWWLTFLCWICEWLLCNIFLIIVSANFLYETIIFKWILFSLWLNDFHYQLLLEIILDRVRKSYSRDSLKLDVFFHYNRLHIIVRR